MTGKRLGGDFVAALASRRMLPVPNERLAQKCIRRRVAVATRRLTQDWISLTPQRSWLADTSADW